MGAKKLTSRQKTIAANKRRKVAITRDIVDAKVRSQYGSTPLDSIAYQSPASIERAQLTTDKAKLVDKLIEHHFLMMNSFYGLISGLVLLLVLSLPTSAHAQFPYGPSVPPRPIYVAQPAGNWVLYNRPTPLRTFVFGPVWVFIPTPPGSQAIVNPVIPALQAPAKTL